MVIQILTGWRKFRHLLRSALNKHLLASHSMAFGLGPLCQYMGSRLRKIMIAFVSIFPFNALTWAGVGRVLQRWDISSFTRFDDGSEAPRTNVASFAYNLFGNLNKMYA